MSATVEPIIKQNPKDACGVLVTASREIDPATGKPVRNHDNMQEGRASLAAMKDRSAMAPDGTVDGAGAMTEIPWELYGDLLSDAGKQKADGTAYGEGDYGVGAIFLPADDRAQEVVKAEINAMLAELGLNAFHWREVPTNLDVLTGKARELHEAQALYQVYFDRPEGMSADDFSTLCYTAMRRIEDKIEAAKEQTSGDLAEKAFADVHVASLDNQRVIYKGLVATDQLHELYPEMDDARYHTRFYLGHARYSTNTRPSIDRVQPFYNTGHNGEFNSVAANREHMHSRTAQGTDAISRLGVSMRPDHSDTQQFDRALLHYLQQNVPLYEAVLRMIPPSPSDYPDLGDEAKNRELAAMFRWFRLDQEPWKGPVNLMTTDGRYLIIHKDESSLRPSRYSLTDKQFRACSEELLNQGEDEILEIFDGLDEAEIILFDMETGEFLENNQVMDRLLGELTEQLRAEFGEEYGFVQLLQDRLAALESESPYLETGYHTDEEVLPLQAGAGWHGEVKSELLASNAVNGKEKTSSMGDEAPFPVISEHFWALNNYLQHAFVQVSAPTLDYVREDVNFDISVALGARPAAKPEAKQLPLSSPILSPGLAEVIRRRGVPPTERLSMTFDARDEHGRYDQQSAEQAMEAAVDALCDAAVQAVRDGVEILILSDADLQLGYGMIPAAVAVSAVSKRLVDEGISRQTSIVAESYQITNPHDAAVLISLGASAVEAPGLYGEMLQMAALYKEYRAGNRSARELDDIYGKNHGDKDASFTEMMDKALFAQILAVALPASGSDEAVDPPVVDQWFNAMNSRRGDEKQAFAAQFDDWVAVQFGDGVSAVDGFNRAMNELLVLSHLAGQALGRQEPMPLQEAAVLYRHVLEGNEAALQAVLGDEVTIASMTEALRQTELDVLPDFGSLERFFLENAQHTLESGLKGSSPRLVCRISLPTLAGICSMWWGLISRTPALHVICRTCEDRWIFAVMAGRRLSKINWSLPSVQRWSIACWM